MRCLLLLFLLIPTAALTQPYFEHRNDLLPLSATGINTMDVESGDIDNDGDLDLIVAGEFSRNLLLFNDGTGAFSEDPDRLFPKKNPNSGFGGEDSEDIGVADFDLDGDLDLLIVSEDTPFHELLINDGTGSFSFSSFEFKSSLGNALAILDLNADQYPDIIIGNGGQNHAYINNQDGTFTSSDDRVPVNTESTQDLKLVDLDGDGDLDLVEGIDLGSNNILINTNGFFEEENDRLPSLNSNLETRKISLGDIDGDTYPDLFISTVNFTGAGNLQNQLYLNDGNGFFTDVTADRLPVFVEQTLDALFIDYDQDNDLDLVTSGFMTGAKAYRAFENNGLGFFEESVVEVFESFTLTDCLALHAFDANGDDQLDIYMGGFNQTDDLLLSTQTVSSKEVVAKEWSVVVPNPAHTFVRISCPTLKDGFSVEASIYSVSGQLVNTHMVQEQSSEHSIEIPVDHLPRGLYFIKLHQEGIEYCFGKVMIIPKP